MAITLTHAGTTLALPDDLSWTDEFTYSPVLQSTERSITGALIVDEVDLTGGTPITLQGTDTSAWIARATLRQLQAWAAVGGTVMTLDLRGESFDVIFAREQSAISAALVIDYADPVDTDHYCSLALRFFTY